MTPTLQDLVSDNKQRIKGEKFEATAGKKKTPVK